MPQGSPLDRVEWSRAGDLLTVDRWLHLGARSRVRVDEHGFLLIEDADQEVQGQFSCRSGSTLSRLSVSVTPRSILSSPEFRSSLETIVVVLLVCTMIYVFGVCVMWLQPREMVRPKIEDAIYEDDAERRHLQPWLDTLEVDSSDYEADSEEDDRDCRHETFVTVQIHKEDQSPVGESDL
ncbi:Hypothetical predicted protein [Cloeon dipterum]|uniref:Uncharacterized protein n=1 Tax=Cloeon dipterum TaxID=197152 RepID=A0A8S1DPI2_9INSE|nr:Hypothetical predicted protein [Cloeon dipterum]